MASRNRSPGKIWSCYKTSERSLSVNPSTRVIRSPCSTVRLTKHLAKLSSLLESEGEPSSKWPTWGSMSASNLVQTLRTVCKFSGHDVESRLPSSIGEVCRLMVITYDVDGSVTNFDVIELPNSHSLTLSGGSPEFLYSVSSSVKPC